MQHSTRLFVVVEYRVMSDEDSCQPLLAQPLSCSRTPVRFVVLFALKCQGELQWLSWTHEILRLALRPEGARIPWPTMFETRFGGPRRVSTAHCSLRTVMGCARRVSGLTEPEFDVLIFSSWPPNNLFLIWG